MEQVEKDLLNRLIALTKQGDLVWGRDITSRGSGIMSYVIKGEYIYRMSVLTGSISGNTIYHFFINNNIDGSVGDDVFFKSACESSEKDWFTLIGELALVVSDVRSKEMCAKLQDVLETLK